MAKKQVAVKPAPSRVQVMPHAHNGYITAKTKYSDEVHEQVVESVKKGYSITDAGLLAGLGKDTLWMWLSNGRHKAEQYPHFAKLSDDIAVAQAERRADAVDAIVSVGTSQLPGSWQASAWYLERTDPENWGRKDKVEHSGQDSAGVRTQINAVVLIDTDAREAARDLLKRVAGHSGADIAIGPGSSMQLEDGET